MGGGLFYPMFEYDFLDKEDLVLIMSNDDSFEDFTIDKEIYWRWVVKNELNAYVMDFFDPKENDAHGQVSGKLKREDYFSQGYQIVKKDLTTYLKTQKKIK